jgi:hypothetical protein
MPLLGLISFMTSQHRRVGYENGFHPFLTKTTTCGWSRQRALLRYAADELTPR